MGSPHYATVQLEVPGFVVTVQEDTFGDDERREPGGLNHMDRQKLKQYWQTESQGKVRDR